MARTGVNARLNNGRQIQKNDLGVFTALSDRSAVDSRIFDRDAIQAQCQKFREDFRHFGIPAKDIPVCFRQIKTTN